MRRKITCAFEISIMIISILAFAYLISDIPSVAAADTSVPSSCCLEGKDGSICQDMNPLDSAMCKEDLLDTSCNQVETCQIGCCYSGNDGLCSLNSPKSKCELTGGNWSSDATCNIAQCQLGCCVLGEESSVTTTRECTRLAEEMNLEKKFTSLDADGTCNTQVGASKLGACLTRSNDYSSQKNCKMTKKADCKTGEFKEGYLCTAKELNTVCKPSKETTCVEGKDQVYYLDSCKNVANVYDSSKFEDQDYWEQIIAPADSCVGAGKDCGNCNYASGFKCSEFRQGKDVKATYGNNVCKNLNCANGRKHGESWCINEYNSEVFSANPVGSRFFKGICMEGDITIEPCADFNQEICTESQSGSLTEAQCQVNEWRSCISANEKEDYAAVAEECKKYDQCTMFLDIPGNEQYADLPGFKKDIANNDQARVGSVGDGMNKVIAHCVPKYTAGMVFWSTKNPTKTISVLDSKKTEEQSFTGIDNGGSLEETKAICSLGSFTCVTQRKQEGTGMMKSESWENTECYENKNPEQAQLWADGLSERCRSLGPCGIYVNVAGEFGSSSENDSSFSRVHINTNGGTSGPSKISTLSASEDYLSSLTGKAGLVKAGSLSSLTAAVILAITGRVADTTTPTDSQSATSAAEGRVSETSPEPMGVLESGFGALGSIGLMNSMAALPAYGMSASWMASGMGSFFGTVGWAAAAAIAGYMVGQLVGKSFGLSNSETQALSYALGAGAAVTTIAYLQLAAPISSACGPWALVCYLVIFLIVMILTYTFMYEEVEYWVTSYTCEPWSPPAEGDCSLCNNDIRTCSEYKCKSLGQNCQYFNQNGEPGYCGTLSETGSATISPWQQALSEGLKYTQVKELGFKIEQQSEEKLEGWTPIQFGITTNEPATCKIDTKHTSSYDAMSTSMILDSSTCESSNCGTQGLNHKIALSPNLGNSSADATVKIKEGENELYIRCKNFAGSWNRAEFVVQMKVKPGPDKTPPIITRFIPVSNSYLKPGTNSTQLTVFVNEPSECRYSQGVNSNYEAMTENLTCFSEDNLAVFGQWPCSGTLNNLAVGQNKFYFQCKDQPELEERSASMRNINRNSKEYVINVCKDGLNITSVSPTNQIITGKSPIQVELKATTSGCIQSGKSICYYKFEDLNSSKYIAFYKTNSNVHSQTFTNIANGSHTIAIKCEDEAGNIDTKKISIGVTLDNSAPTALRTYNYNGQLVLITDENSKCSYTTNSSIGCGFILSDKNISSMEGIEKFHKTTWVDNRDYFIKCSDPFENENANCGIIVRTYE